MPGTKAQHHRLVSTFEYTIIMVTNIKITSGLKTTNILMPITKPIKHKTPHVTHHFKAT